MIVKYFIAWFGMMILAILNGGFRDFAYKPHVGDLAAHQVSTVILLLLFAGFFWFLVKVWPIGSPIQAWKIGGMWFLMTEGFEFGMGRLIVGEPWNKLFHAYNVLDGQVWLFIPLWVLVGPYLFFRNVQAKQVIKK
ncbi:MAG: hypothetical protein V2B19_31095 [Pseudomonadota bacterium]